MCLDKSMGEMDYKKAPLLSGMDDSESHNGNGMSEGVSEGVSKGMIPNHIQLNDEQERTVLPFPETDEFVRLANETARYPANIIVTTRYTVLSFFPKSLFEQFRRLANVYFLVLGCIAAIGVATEYYDTAVEPAGLLIPLTIVVLISVAKDGIEDAKRNKADNRTNCRMTRIVHGDVSDVM
jgi:hypothetical protein